MNASGRLRVSEEMLASLDGVVIDVEVQSMPILCGGAPALLGSMRDITEQNGWRGGVAD